MKILITGGTGFIGSHLANYLSIDNDVTVCDNNFRGKYDQFVKGLNYIECDLTRTDEYVKLGRYDVVYHLAAINGTKNFYEFPCQVMETNTLINFNMIRWCKDIGIKKILYTSSSEVYASNTNKIIPSKEEVSVSIENVYNPRWSYAASKILGEMMFINSGLNYSIVRPHNVYGPRMGYDHVIPEVITRILSGETPFKVYGANQTRSFCYIGDAVRMLDNIMNNNLSDKKIINLGVQTETKIGDLVYMIMDIMNYSPSEIINVESKEGSVDRRCPDTTLLTNITNITNLTSLKDGLLRTCQWYKQNALL